MGEPTPHHFIILNSKAVTASFSIPPDFTSCQVHLIILICNCCCYNINEMEVGICSRRRDCISYVSKAVPWCLISFQNASSKKTYQMHLKSSVGPIYVLLVNKDIDCPSPVAIEVPPPKSVLDSSAKVLDGFSVIVCKQFVVSLLNS
jgi:hypothetical protein